MIKLKSFFESNSKVIMIISIIILLGFVYFFSSMDYFKTNNVSRKFTKSIVGIVGKNKSEREINSFVNRANTYVRKMAHLFLFFNLGVFVSLVMKSKYKLEIRYSILAVIICMIFGGLDEFHQMFVPGRSSRFADVIIDTVGSLLGILFVNYMYIRVRPRIQRLQSMSEQIKENKSRAL